MESDMFNGDYVMDDKLYKQQAQCAMLMQFDYRYCRQWIEGSECKGNIVDRPIRSRLLKGANNHDCQAWFTVTVLPMRVQCTVTLSAWHLGRMVCFGRLQVLPLGLPHISYFRRHRRAHTIVV